MNSKYISQILFACILFCGLLSCQEKEWSEDYDIDYPVSTVASFAPTQQKVGGEVTITGVNLEHVLYVSIGNLRCTIKSKNSTTIVITIPANTPKSYISVENVYMRKYVYEKEVFTPIP